MRNVFYSECHKRRREIEDSDGSYTESLTSRSEQHGRVEVRELVAAIAELPSGQREAIILVGALGFSYDDAAAISKCAAGTMKSRVNRARTKLAEALEITGADEFGAHQMTRIALGSSSGRKDAIRHAGLIDSQVDGH